MQTTAIEWTNRTWNPTRGCSRISPGCVHCYAETFANRFVGVKGHAYERGFEPRFVEKQLAAPFSVAKNELVFVNSVSDLFHDAFSVDEIRRVLEVTRAADWLVFQVLTKRAARMRELMTGPLAEFAGLPNVWFGVSVENRQHGMPRITELREIPAKTRFLSVEPLLEDLGELDLRGIAWVIVGGESGPGARPCDVTWIRSVVRQCGGAAGVPVWFKQYGLLANNPDAKDPTATKNGGSTKGGCRLDGDVIHELPPRLWKPVPPKAERLARRDALLGVVTTKVRADAEKE